MPERTLLLIVLQAVGVYCNRFPANLTATDAYPALGGYVVPVNGNITFRCEAQGPDYDRTTGLRWNIAMGIYSGNKTHASVFASKFSNRFTHLLADVNNPAILCIHNLQLSENRSTVQCLVANVANSGSQVITMYVEDIPNCVENLNITFTDTSCVVSWNRYNGLLPVMYNISIWSTSNNVVQSESTVHTILHLDSNIYNLQLNTTYFVLVTTCNRAGCSEDCGNTSLYTGDLHEIVHDSLPTKVGRNSTSLSGGTLIIIVVPVAVALVSIILIVVILLFCCIGSCQMSKTRDVVQQSASQQNDHEHMSERVQETSDVSHSSIDVTGVVMEENPAYGTVPIRMGETDMAELPPPLPLRPQDTVNLDMQENPSYSL